VAVQPLGLKGGGWARGHLERVENTIILPPSVYLCKKKFNRTFYCLVTIPRCYVTQRKAMASGTTRHVRSIGLNESIDGSQRTHHAVRPLSFAFPNMLPCCFLSSFEAPPGSAPPCAQHANCVLSGFVRPTQSTTASFRHSCCTRHFHISN
jgi:hypothetical protein